ncbi:MAG TPA: TerC family protein [Anaerolineales bacterium]|nr:TerC family protein [Anaerolineales bacterium]HRQ92997.1 TerC family protein [Anaerolineales bacterium]
MEWLSTPEAWIALLTLTALEIVLGIDNLVFITILATKLPKEQQLRAERLGLGLAMFMRIALLLSIKWIIGLTAPLFTLWDFTVSGRDLILLLGGLFLIGKSTFEIHDKLEGEEDHHEQAKAGSKVSFSSVVLQIILLDAVFSIDSVITAVGLADSIYIMIAAVVIAVIVMALTVGYISDFVQRHPTIKILALSFLILIGFSLVVEGLHQHIPKGYIYFAMGFSILVEFLNMRLRSLKTAPVQLRATPAPPPAGKRVASPKAEGKKPASKKTAGKKR